MSYTSKEYDVWCFGSSNWGQLGGGDRKKTTQPQRVTLLCGAGVVAVHLGGSHTSFITQKGTAYICGKGDVGQFGKKLSAASKGCLSIPQSIGFFNNMRVSHVKCGIAHTMLVTGLGELFTFGDNTHGQLGIGDPSTTPRSSTPLKIISEYYPILDIWVGPYQSAAMKDDGSMYVWGDCRLANLGVGYKDYVQFTPCLWSLSYIISMEYGRGHGVAVTTSGDVYTWGQTGFGVLGHGPRIAELLRPTLLPMENILGNKEERIISVACGEFHTILLSSFGRVFSFGFGREGVLGNGNDSSPCTIPQEISSLTTDRSSKKKIIQIACGSHHSMALTEDGVVYHWGRVIGEVEEDQDKLIREEALRPTVGLVLNGTQSLISSTSSRWGLLDKEQADALGERIRDSETHILGALKGGEASIKELMGGGRKLRFGSKKVKAPKQIAKKFSSTDRSNIGVGFGRSSGSGGEGIGSGIGGGGCRSVSFPVKMFLPSSDRRVLIASGGDTAAIITVKEHDINDPPECQVDQLSFFVGSWNVGGERPVVKLYDWLVPPTPPPDIYVIGFQELIPLGAEGLVDDLLTKKVNTAGEDTATEAMRALIKRHINEKQPGQYSLLHSRQLFGVYLVIYVKTKLMARVKNFQVASAAMRKITTAGSKGGVGMRFEIFGRSFCFICAHLAAGQKKVAKRNGDYFQVMNKIRFEDYNKPRGFLSPIEADTTVFFGDLNYRIDLDRSTVTSAVYDKNYERLIVHDQLRREQSCNRVLLGFKEGKIDFAPTYKYDPGTGVYDTSPLQRIPAYCDRILWRGDKVTQVFYGRHEIMASDHRPISAIFTIPCMKKSSVMMDMRGRGGRGRGRGRGRRGDGRGRGDELLVPRRFGGISAPSIIHVSSSSPQQVNQILEGQYPLENEFTRPARSSSMDVYDDNDMRVHNHRTTSVSAYPSQRESKERGKGKGRGRGRGRGKGRGRGRGRGRDITVRDFGERRGDDVPKEISKPLPSLPPSGGSRVNGSGRGIPPPVNRATQPKNYVASSSSSLSSSSHQERIREPSSRGMDYIHSRNNERERILEERRDIRNKEEYTMGEVLYNFTPEAETEVAVIKGEIVNVVKIQGEWALVITPNGEEGHIPVSYMNTNKSTIDNDRNNSYIPIMISKEKEREKEKEERTFGMQTVWETEEGIYKDQGSWPTSIIGPSFGVSLDTLETVEDFAVMIPKCLYLMRENLYTIEGLKEEGIFRVSGSETQLTEVKRQINIGSFTYCDDAYLLAALIKRWFSELPVRLLAKIPDKILVELTQKGNSPPSVFLEFPLLLDPERRALFLWITRVLLDTTRLHNENKMTIQNLATVVAPVLAHKTSNMLEDLTRTGRVAALLRKYLDAQMALL